jgi:hypothetical protein
MKKWFPADGSGALSARDFWERARCALARIGEKLCEFFLRAALALNVPNPRESAVGARVGKGYRRVTVDLLVGEENGGKKFAGVRIPAGNC